MEQAAASPDAIEFLIPFINARSPPLIPVVCSFIFDCEDPNAVLDGSADDDDPPRMIQRLLWWLSRRLDIAVVGWDTAFTMGGRSSRVWRVVRSRRRERNENGCMVCFCGIWLSRLPSIGLFGMTDGEERMCCDWIVCGVVHFLF